MMKWLQKLGKALMLPVAALPVCGILMGIGYALAPAVMGAEGPTTGAAYTVGFLLVTIFSRGGSLLPCILVHSAINTLGTFANDAELTMQTQLLHLAALILLTVGYTQTLKIPHRK